MKRLLFGLAVVATSSLSAQTTLYGPLAIRLPASARALAMGNVAVAGRDDDVIFYNPAQLMVARGTSASAERITEDVRGGTTSTTLRLGGGAVGIGINYLEYKAAFAVYPLSREDIYDASRPAASSTLASLGYALSQWGCRFGLSANYAVDQIGLSRYRSVLADVGVAKDFMRYFTGAFALQHIGSAPGDVGVSMARPMRATLGVSGSGPAGPLDLVGTVAVSAIDEGHVAPAAGAEVSWSWLSGYSIQGRAGARYPHELGDGNFTAGFGFIADRVAIDVAAEFLPNSRVGYRAGFRIR